jgi:hypothetical protein
VENKKTAIREGWLFWLTCADVIALLRSYRRQNKKLPTFSGKWASDDVYAAVQKL